MAVLEISPFSYQNFSIQFRPLADWIISYVQKNSIHGQSGWLQQLQGYNYSKGHIITGAAPVWEQGIKKRACFYTRLHSPTLTNQQLMNVVNNIMEWGGMKPYDLSLASSVRNALKALASETSTSILTNQIVNALALTGRVAARSKIFEMYDPTKWVIYDSRVANALACLTDKFTNHTPGVLNWPIPASRKQGFSPAPGYQGCHTPRQGSLAFIYASWLSRMVADTLNSSKVYPDIPAFSHPVGTLSIPTGTWQTYHVEMVLWMLGAKLFCGRA